MSLRSSNNYYVIKIDSDFCSHEAMHVVVKSCNLSKEKNVNQVDVCRQISYR